MRRVVASESVELVSVLQGRRGAGTAVLPAARGEGAVIVYKVRWTIQQREAFAKRVLRFRERYGLTQDILALGLEISVATVNRIERGKYVPRDETVQAFADLEKRYKEGESVERSLAWVPGDAEEI